MKWILVYNILMPYHSGLNLFNEPVIMDSFVSQAQCESALEQLETVFVDRGKGHCWGEE